MIFGAVHDTELDGRIRVTVIATGFGAEVEEEEPVPTLKVVPTTTPPARDGEREGGPRLVPAGRGSSEESIGVAASKRTSSATAGHAETQQPQARFGLDASAVGRAPLEDLEIPTFIRRQMD